MQVAIISDTHVPSRATAIPDEFRDRIRDADHVIHAGDFDSKGAIADVREMAAELTAVEGNTDPQVGLPSVASVELGGLEPNRERSGSGAERSESPGVEFVVTHGTGSKRGYEDRVANAVRQHGGRSTAASPPGHEEDADLAIGVAGHTHEVMDRTHCGVRLLNPGSATGASPASRTTMLTAEVVAGDVDETLREL